MQSLSLIEAIVLLDEKENCNKPIRGVGRKIERFNPSPENLALARALFRKILGRKLNPLPWKTQILFLLIEKMAEKQCRAKKIERSAYRFTREEVRLETNWSDAQLKLHLNRLLSLDYLLMHRNARKQSCQYELLHNSKSVITIDLPDTNVS